MAFLNIQEIVDLVENYYRPKYDYNPDIQLEISTGNGRVTITRCWLPQDRPSKQARFVITNFSSIERMVREIGDLS